MVSIWKWLMSTPKEIQERRRNESSSEHVDLEDTFLNDFDYRCNVGRALNCAYAAYKDLLNDDYIPNVMRYSKSLQEAVEELRLYSSDSRFRDIVEATWKESNRMGISLNTNIKSAVSNPFDLDAGMLTCNRIIESVLAYRPYWEKVIAELTLKSAVIKRRRYLVGKLEEMANLIDCYPEMVAILLEYRDFNVQELQKMDGGS